MLATSLVRMKIIVTNADIVLLGVELILFPSGLAVFIVLC